MKKILIILFFILLAGSIFFTGCKTQGESQGEHRIVITINNGVTGTPGTGTYYYDTGTVINYSYSLDEYFTNLVVKVDSEDAEATGSLTVVKDHTITANATGEYLIMGTWTMQESYVDGRKFTVTIVFTGDKENGTVTDSDDGTGAYEVPDKNSIAFTLVFPNVTYEYSGIFAGVNTMSGTAKRISTVSGELLGSWRADRVTGAAARQSSTGNKGK